MVSIHADSFGFIYSGLIGYFFYHPITVEVEWYEICLLLEPKNASYRFWDVWFNEAIVDNIGFQFHF